MTWRLAQLVRREGKCLDVVIMEETADKPNKIRGLGNTPNRQVIGKQNFLDSDSAIAVLTRFNSIHSSPMGDVCVSRKGRYAYVSYPIQDEATVFLAFDRYFRNEH